MAAFHKLERLHHGSQVAEGENPFLKGSTDPGRPEKNIIVRCWKDAVEFGSCGSVRDRPDALQMFRESAIDSLTAYCSQNRLWTGRSLVTGVDCPEEQGHVGKFRDRCGDLWEGQDVSVMFYRTYEPVFTWVRYC